MVSLTGYPIDAYAVYIITSYVLLGVLAIVRFFVEREKMPSWKFVKGKWVSRARWKYLYVAPIVAAGILLLVYTLDVRIGFVMAVNGITGTLIVTELSKRLV